MKKIIVVLLVIVLVIVAVNFLPNKGTISYKKNDVGSVKAEAKINFKGKKINFDYWTGYELRSNSTTEDNYSLIGPSGKTDIWTIMLVKNSTLDESSGVIMRRIKKEIYEEMPYKNGVVFVNKDAGEKVYFENTADGLLSVAVTNLADGDKFDELINSVGE